jgi:hypothetical protein
VGPRPLRALWGWGYRFEAYTPAAKRVYGYYALPLAWRDRVVGWVNADAVEGRIVVRRRLPGRRAARPRVQARARRGARPSLAGVSGDERSRAVRDPGDLGIDVGSPSRISLA